MPKKLNIKIFLIPGIIFFLFLSFCIYIFVEPYLLEVRRTDIYDEDVPDSFDNFKIVFFADIHHGLFFSEARVKKLVEKINKMNPDVIFAGGDFVGNWLFEKPKYIPTCFAELKNLKAKYGVFGVLGNHDVWTDKNLSLEEMEKSGIVYLGNKGQWLEINGEKIKIGGVKDFYEDIQDANDVIDDTTEDDFVLLLTHSPDYAEKIDNNKIDLVLSGHTHGGQMTFFGLWAPATSSRYGQKYRTGLIETSNTKVLVTNGVGSILPIRFFARPQINIINLKKK
ncbi:MAG TPA: metallophosphoesterase [Patescibacteria group bacterium]|nr:metallophosphoesterase [Patescibacteria group bacterium]